MRALLIQVKPYTPQCLKTQKIDQSGGSICMRHKHNYPAMIIKTETDKREVLGDRVCVFGNTPDNDFLP